jgi:bacterioferritin-associated ferredoxin
MKTRCECRELSFVGLLLFARRHGITTLDELMKATGCGTECGNCRPYLEELLRTGKLHCGDQSIDLSNIADGERRPPATPSPERGPAESTEPTPPPRRDEKPEA